MTNSLRLLVTGALFLALAVGCGKGSPSAKPAPEKDAKSEPAPPAPAGHHGGDVVELGKATIGPWGIRLSRDGGLVPGKDAGIDIWVESGTPHPDVVRFWIGNEDAVGSVKALAGMEEGHPHTHVEIPEPLPDTAKLWVELQDAAGARHVGGVDLRR